MRAYSDLHLTPHAGRPILQLWLPQVQPNYEVYRERNGVKTAASGRRPRFLWFPVKLASLAAVPTPVSPVYMVKGAVVWSRPWVQGK